MYLLQATYTDWYPGLYAILLMILTPIVIILVGYLLLRAAIRAATKEQRRQAKITNLLLVEQLKSQGVSDEIIKGILDTK